MQSNVIFSSLSFKVESYFSVAASVQIDEEKNTFTKKHA